MKKTYSINGLDCASCAEKLERTLGRIKGVKGAGVNFMMQKLCIEVEDGSAEEVLAEVVKKARRFEDGLELTETD